MVQKIEPSPLFLRFCDAMNRDTMLLAFNRNKLVRRLLLVTGILVICHLFNVVTGGPSWQLERMFDLDLESNVPTWFSSFLITLAALAAYRCSRLSRALRHKRLLLALAVVLLFLSCDEVAMFHENIGSVLGRYLFHWPIFETWKGPIWPFILGPFAAVAFIWLGSHLRKVLRGSVKSAKLLGLGAALWLMGAIGFELAGNFLNYEPLLWVKKIEIVFEESLEMVGAITFLAGLLTHEQFLSQNYFDETAVRERCQV